MNVCLVLYLQPVQVRPLSAILGLAPTPYNPRVDEAGIADGWVFLNSFSGSLISCNNNKKKVDSLIYLAKMPQIVSQMSKFNLVQFT